MLQIIHLGLCPYTEVWDRMKQFTIDRHQDTPDELWLLEHPPVFTQGQAGKPEHVIHPTHIPIVQSDRGGQITYHAPGQLVGYVLMDIRRRHMGIRTLVSHLEQIIINLLRHLDISSQTKCNAPGVYVDDKKIASIGLRVKNGCTYHGIALNVAMDLSPFSYINPCGFAKLQMTQIQDFVPNIEMNKVSDTFIKEFIAVFGDQQAS